MKRRRMLKGIGATGLLAVSGSVVAAATTGDDRTIVEHSEGPGDYYVLTGPSADVGQAGHEGGDCSVACCNECDCPGGCHCIDPNC